MRVQLGWIMERLIKVRGSYTSMRCCKEVIQIGPRRRCPVDWCSVKNRFFFVVGLEIAKNVGSIVRIVWNKISFCSCVWCGVVRMLGVVGVGMRSGPCSLCRSRIWPEVGDNYRHSLHTSCQQAWVIVVADDFRCCVPRNDTPAHFVTPGMGGEVTEVRPDLLPRECPFRAQEMLQPSLHQQVDSSSQVYDSRVAEGSRMLPCPFTRWPPLDYIS